MPKKIVKDKNLPVKKEISEVVEIPSEDKIIDEAVKFINEKANKMLYIGSIEIGEYLLKTFFNNDIKEASSRNPRKNVSYHKLCERDDIVVKVEQLSVMVRVAAQERFFKEKKIDVDKLSYTHKAELIKISDNKEKIKLVADCINNSLSTRDLSKEIHKIKSKHIKQIPSDKQFVRYSNKIVHLLEESKKTEFQLDTLKGMKTKLLDNIRTTADDISKKLEYELKKYQEIINNIDKIQEEKGKEA